MLALIKQRSSDYISDNYTAIDDRFDASFGNGIKYMVLDSNCGRIKLSNGYYYRESDLNILLEDIRIQSNKYYVLSYDIQVLNAQFIPGYYANTPVKFISTHDGNQIITADNNIFYINTQSSSATKKLLVGYMPSSYHHENVDDIRNCIRCGNTFTILANEHIDSEDANLCAPCRTREYVAPYHRYEPKLQFHTTDDTAYKHMFIGFELEVGIGGEDNDEAKKVMRIMNTDTDKYIYCSHDSSIENGFEIISHPCSYEYHCKMKERMSKMMQTLVDDGYDCKTSNCGLHFHISREFFGDDEAAQETNIVKFIFLFNEFWNHIVKFSQKSKRLIDNYSKPIDESPLSYYRRWNKSHRHDGHYYAINVTNDNTVEIRIFRATLNVNVFYAMLNLTYNLAVKSKNNSIAFLRTIDFVDVLDKDSLRYYNEFINFKSEWSE